MVGQLLLALSILVILHECGHFFPAKWFKIRVEKFYLFFDPWFSVVKKQVGDTEYGIGWLPLGGYVKIAGMMDESMDKEQMKLPPKPWEFRSKPAWQRLIIMIGGVVVNFLLGILIFIGVNWAWGKDFLPTSEVKYGMAFDSTMLRTGFQDGDLLLKIGDSTLTRVEPGTFLKEVLLRNARIAVVRRNGEEVKITLTEEFVAESQKGGRRKKSLMLARMPFEIDSVAPNKPAAAAGLRKGDRIIGLADTIFTPYHSDFVKAVAPFAEKKVKVIALRGSDTLRLEITPTAEGKIGVGPREATAFFKFGHQPFTLAQAIPQGYRDASGFLGDQLSAFAQMFRGKINAKDNLGSLISIGRMYGPVWDWERFWIMTASLSIILAFMNLLPIPALDGGYVMFLLWEVGTGKRVSDSFMEKAITVGFFLMLGLMVLALGLDISRLF